MDTNQFPFFNNKDKQLRSQYECFFAKGTQWDCNRFQMAMEIYQLRCNLNIIKKGNEKHQSYACCDDKCTFEVHYQLSKKSNCFSVSKFVSHSCKTSLTILSKPIHVKYLKQLVAIEKDVEVMKPVEIRTALEEQSLLPGNMTEFNKNMLSKRLLEELTHKNKYNNINGIEAFKEKFEQMDVHNKCIIICDNNRYKSSQIILGHTQRMLTNNKSVKLLDFDGCHLKHNMGILLGLTISDANNETYLLSLAHLAFEESTEAWDNFYATLLKHIPTLFDREYSFCSDRDSGITAFISALEDGDSDMDGIESSMSICVAHLKRNIYSLLSISNKKEKEELDMILNPIIYAETMNECDNLLEKLKKTNRKLHEYLSQIKKEKYCFSFSKRREKLTSNSVESYWNWILKLRLYKSVTKIYIKVYEKNILKIESAIKFATENESPVTPFASAQVIHILETNMISFNQYTVSNNTVFTSKGNYLTSITTRKCSCRQPEVSAFPCTHLLFICKKRNLLGSIEQIVDPRYTTVSWVESLKSSHPLVNLNFDVSDLANQNNFSDPTYKRKRGRPKIIIQDRSHLPRRSRSTKNTFKNKLENLKFIPSKKNKKFKSITTRIRSKGEVIGA